jgi:hypothetical protein
MQPSGVFGILIGVSIFLFLLVNLAIWFVVSQKMYTGSVHPGDIYKIGDTSYRVPDLVLKGSGRFLQESYLLKQRNLLKNVSKAFRRLKIKHWVSGGTLLGFTRHGTFIPWDDDCDIHTIFENRKYMYSQQFTEDLKAFNLEPIYLVGSSADIATREGAAVRVRKISSTVPICDVFFVEECEREVYKKVDAWKGLHLKFSRKEIWNKDQIFPLKHKNVDGLNLVFPNKPVEVLQQQYGKKVMEEMHARHVLFSHLYPFSQLPFLWKTKKMKK